MARTFKRQPLSISTSSKSYPKEQTLAQIDFKGTNDTDNDLTVDQSSFSDTQNMWIDEHNMLSSRPLFVRKFSERDTENIVKAWHFGETDFVLYKYIVDAEGNRLQIDRIDDYQLDELRVAYELCALENDQISVTYEWSVPFYDIGDQEPEIFATQIEDKVFFWIAGIDFIAYDTVAENFVDAHQYLYVPTTELILSNLKYDYEDKNFLTDSYKRRYQYSALSTLSYDELIGKTLEVNLTNIDGGHRYLYDMTWTKDSEKVLLVPKSIIGDTYHIDIVHTPRATVILRYGLYTKRIEVSFDGKYFKSIPTIDGMLGNPILTKDGLYIIAFTEKAIYKYKLVAHESTDFAQDEEVAWLSFPYLQYAVENYAYKRVSKIDTDYTPIGNFDAIDQFAYQIMLNGEKYLYTQWQDSQGIRAGFYSYSDARSVDRSIILNRFVPQGISTNAGMIVAVIDEQNGSYTDIRNAYFQKTSDNTGIVYNGDAIFFNYKQRYIYKLTSDQKSIVTGKVPIYSGDAVILMHKPEFTGAKTTLVYGGVSYTRDTTYRETSLLSSNSGMRYIVTSQNEVLRYGDEVTIKSIPTSIKYTGYDILNIMGITDASLQQGFFVYYSASGVTKMFSPDDSALNTDVNSTAYDIDQFVLSPDALAPNTEQITFSGSAIDPHTEYQNQANGTAYISTPEVNAENITYSILYATNINELNGQPGIKDIVSQANISIDTKNKLYEVNHEIVMSSVYFTSSKFVADANTGMIITDNYLYREGQRKFLPENLRNSIPLSINDDIVYYLVGDELWSTEIDADVIVNLDEYVGCDGKIAIANEEIPTYAKTLAEHYFAFEGLNGKHLLEITSTRRKDVNGNYDFLLYLPKANEQILPDRITNLCPLSENTMGVFDEEGAWYISSITSENDVLYTKAARSKIPLGCRNGDDVVVALDGQALIMPTRRGITAIRPELLTTGAEQNLSYLSDAIQNKWTEYYSSPVNVIDGDTIIPEIKIHMALHQILFYKKYDREILFFDTRNGSWWKWTTPYPIQQITSDTDILFKVDPYPRKSIHSSNYAVTLRSYNGVEYKLTSVYEKYADDIISGTVNGDWEKVDTGSKNGTKYVRNFMANGTIDWYFVSQKLHFGQINNYKQVKSINLNLRGNSRSTAKLSTKVFRNAYHPEQSDVLEMNVNELQTFIARLNLMHVINFQYKLENDESLEPAPFKLNCISIKYEVKEKIR
jgi:hypothetical protein